MIKVEKVEVAGLETAVRGMRNPLKSWELSDSYWDTSENLSQFVIGEKDLKLAQQLLAAGPDHSKFIRQIYVGFDLTAPLYFWKQFDTYKVATVANSESTMHTLDKKIISLNDFSFEGENPGDDKDWATDIRTIIYICEMTRQKYVQTKDKKYYKRLVQILPEGFNQKRTITCSYATLRNMYFARKNHRLEEWKDFTNFILTLPYGKELIAFEK